MFEPTSPWSTGSMALSLFGMASLPTVLERVCAAPLPAVDALVAKTLDLMAQPAARKNIVLFLGASLHQLRLLEAFDRQVQCTTDCNLRLQMWKSLNRAVDHCGDCHEAIGTRPRGTKQ